MRLEHLEKFAFINNNVNKIYKEQTMSKQHFVYMWYDKSRKMFYVGKHSGKITDKYTSSNRWLNGEIKYRPSDFKRKILKLCESENAAEKLEGRLLSMISSDEWGKKYYNAKQGKPKGVAPWNKGKKGIYSDETLQKMSEARLGKPTTKGMANPTAADSGRKGAKKQSQTVTGRKRVIRDGLPRWAYPSDPDYPT